jgi:hypothetical protein
MIEACLRRGDLELAEKLLARVGSRPGRRLRAVLFAQQRKGKESLAELDAELNDADHRIATDIAFDEALILMRMARYEESQAAFERALNMDEHSARLPEALFWLGAYDVLSKGLDAGGARWRQLVDEYPENRWAWKAAANLAKVGCLINGAERLAWPEPDLVASVTRPRAEVLPASDTERVERDAIDYLVHAQRADGTWINPADAFSIGSNLYTPAVCALCAASLLPSVADKGPAACVKSAIAHLLELERGGRLEPGPGVIGPYSIWSRTCALLFFARCVRAHVGDEAELTRAMSALVTSIAKSQHAHGGWPYIAFAGDPSGEGFDPSASFLTSGVVIALAEARAAGVDVPQDALAKAVAFLARMRQSDGSYRYMPDIPNAIVDGAAPEAAGRGPLCSLAIERGERALARDGATTKHDDDATRIQRARNALESFVKHRGGFKREWHKELCHTSPEGFGAHYIFYDYLFAAECVRSMPREESARYRSLIAEDVLAARFADGSFEDLPLLGRAYATAMALMTLRELRAE